MEFRGDSPVKYWSETGPEEPGPFGLTEINRGLAALGREAATCQEAGMRTTARSTSPVWSFS